MTDASRGDDVSPGLTYFAGTTKAATPQVAAYLPSYDGDLTVYWRGQVDRGDVCLILKEAEAALLKSGGKMEGTIDAYGIKGVKEDASDTERHIGPVSKDLFKHFASKIELPEFDACRAELTVSQGTVVVWANVSGEESAELIAGGENIGLSMPQRLFMFKGPVRPVIERAISNTMGLDGPVVSGLLDDISSAIQSRSLTAGD